MPCLVRMARTVCNIGKGHRDAPIVLTLEVIRVKRNFVSSDAFPRGVVVWYFADAVSCGHGTDVAFRGRHHATASATRETSLRYGVEDAVGSS